MIRPTTHLEAQVGQQGNDKGCVKAAETGGAEPERERGIRSVFGIRRPHLAAVVAFPNDIILPVMPAW